MDIVLHNSADTPFYHQIASQIKAQIMDGSLVFGQELPSIRHLANELHISVITTKRAYSELARLGFIEQVPGKGSFVADCSTNVIREEQIRQLERDIEACAKKARALGISKQEFLFMADVATKEEVHDV